MLAQGIRYAAEPLLNIMEVRDKKLLEQASEVSMGVSCSPSFLQRNLRKLCEANFACFGARTRLRSSSLCWSV